MIVVWKLMLHKISRLSLRLILLITSLLLMTGCGADGVIHVELADEQSSHVYNGSKRPSVELTVIKPKGIDGWAQWVDFRGKSLGEKHRLVDRGKMQLKAPDAGQGYYGLRISGDLPSTAVTGFLPGEYKEYGFSVLPAADSNVDEASSQFGMVHAKVEDPYLPRWVKTMTWKTRGPDGWKAAIKEHAKVGKSELPIIVSGEWVSDDRQPISKEALAIIKERSQQYFVADPSVRYWELGIEENLSKNYHQKYYWSNLASKVAAVKQASLSSGANVKLIYQIAERRKKDIRKFLDSKASKEFDILAIHPYAWPDFRTPETWLPGFQQFVRDEMTARGHTFPIWYTEVGAPHHGNPLGFFGYPEDGAQVTGVSLYSATPYLLKLHVMGLAEGVEKIFWYNYVDQHSEREYAENFFGLIDYWRFPKPAYTAYVTMVRLLEGKPLVEIQAGKNDLYSYTFSDKKETVSVLWRSPEAAPIPFSSVVNNQSVKVFDLVGHEINGESLTALSLGTEPVYVLYPEGWTP